MLRGIEFLVVSVIVVLLGATIAAAVSGFRDRASESACSVTRTQVRRAVDERWAIRGTYPADIKTLVDEGLLTIPRGVALVATDTGDTLGSPTWNIEYRYFPTPTPHFTLESAVCGT